VNPPRADGRGVALRHDAGDLDEVVEVVGGPGGEELGEGAGAELGVAAALGEVVVGELPAAEGFEVLRAEGGEGVEELGEGAAGAGELGEAVEGIEGTALALLEDDPGAGDPVGALAVDQVADDRMGGSRCRGPRRRRSRRWGGRGGGRRGPRGVRWRTASASARSKVSS